MQTNVVWLRQAVTGASSLISRVPDSHIPEPFPGTRSSRLWYLQSLPFFILPSMSSHQWLSSPARPAQRHGNQQVRTPEAPCYAASNPQKGPISIKN